MYTVYLLDGSALGQGSMRMMFSEELEGQGDHGFLSVPFDEVHSLIPHGGSQSMVVVTKSREAKKLRISKPLLLVRDGDERALDLRQIKIVRLPYEEAKP